MRNFQHSIFIKAVSGSDFNDNSITILQNDKPLSKKLEKEKTFFEIKANIFPILSPPKKNTTIKTKLVS